MDDIPLVASTNMEPRPLARLIAATVAALTLTVAASCVSIAFDISRLSVLSHLLSDTVSGDLTRLQSDVAAGPDQRQSDLGNRDRRARHALRLRCLLHRLVPPRL